MNAQSPEHHTNRLSNETSPYLLQHAHNPVDWYPWGEEALERARAENRLILLSIGYSACHWCHVMERESFENEEIAELMNRHYVNIKVDREERPDLDEIYMTATMALNRGQGGWPMTVILTPDLDPVFAGTYFPPMDVPGRPGFPTVLNVVARSWQEEPERLKEGARQLVEFLRERQELDNPQLVEPSVFQAALHEYGAAFDPKYGGFGPPPKFPPSTALMLLLRIHQRIGDPKALEMVALTLEAMARGGMYDHIGGGFARYSTDARWLVPHFEKMLYDNALLARAYLEGFQVTGTDLFREVAVETLDYVLREMTSDVGAFFSSTDADSEGEEGKFFVWHPDQIAMVLSADEARVFCAYYDITESGNWEGKSIPNVPAPPERVAERLGISLADLTSTLEKARPQVYQARQERVKPGLDDKVITAWNGLMIGALAEGYRILREPRYREAAHRCAVFLRETMKDTSGRLLRTYREGKAHLPAHLEDYAYLTEALVGLYEVSGDESHLEEADRLVEIMLEDYREEGGPFYHTPSDHERLPIRYRDGTDGATPAANGTAALTLARLGYHLDRPGYREAAREALEAYGTLMTAHPRAFAKSLIACEFLLEDPVELVMIGASGSSDLEALESRVAAHYLPRRVQAVADPREGSSLPLTAGKTMVDDRAALYICRNYACQAPITDLERIDEELSQLTAPEST